MRRGSVKLVGTNPNVCSGYSFRKVMDGSIYTFDFGPLTLMHSAAASAFYIYRLVVSDAHEECAGRISEPEDRSHVLAKSERRRAYKGLIRNDTLHASVRRSSGVTSSRSFVFIPLTRVKHLTQYAA